MKDKRKVSDVIVELDTKITRMMGLSQNTDHNIQLILGKFNALVREVEELKQQLGNNTQNHSAPPKRQSVVVDTQGIVGGPSVAPSEEESIQPQIQQPKPSIQQPQHDPLNDVLVAMPVNKNSAADDELVEEAIHKGARRGLRVPGNSDASPRRSVSQKVLFPDGRSVAFAQIEIFNKSGFLVKQTRTSPSGVWVAPLEPGEYKVHLLKRMSADGSKLPVELDMKIMVPDSAGSHELPSPELPEIYMQGE